MIFNVEMIIPARAEAWHLKSQLEDIPDHATVTVRHIKGDRPRDTERYSIVFRWDADHPNSGDTRK